MKKNYELSVVTPFHDTDLSLFEQTVYSMRRQTYGYENIQWVVVLHNCGQSFTDGVYDLIGRDENVVLCILNNDIHTASSPRNYGMQYVTGTYIGFLDSDDSFLPDYAETVLEAIKRNQAEAVVFRREFEKEDSNLSTITELVLWDQTRKEILLKDDEIIDERLFVSAWGLVTSKVFDLDFLRRHHITFDEEVAMGEDFLFCIDVYAASRRILVLPQYIGYHYVIHGSSIVQNSSTPGDRLVFFSRGYVKLFSRGLELGFPMNATINALTAIIAGKMLSSNDLTLEQRLEIRDLLKPFIEQTYPIVPNKIYPPKRSADLYEINHSVILHPEQWEDIQEKSLLISAADPNEQQTGPYAVLQRILEQNADTDFGHRYGFASLWTIRAYQSRVPVTDSETYRPLVRLQTQTGESSIFSANPILTYYTDFDEQGTPMLFPCTEAAMKQYMEQMELVLKGKTTFLNMECLPGHVSYNDKAASDSLSAMFLKQYYARVYPRMRGTGTHLTAPQALFFPPENTDTRYARLLFALRHRDLDQIWSLTAWDLLNLFEYMEEVWPALLKDIEEGSMKGAASLSPEFAGELELFLPEDPKRAAELRDIFSKGFEEPIVPKIWPNLKRIIANGSGDYTMYGDHLHCYTGNIPVKNGAFVLCGGILGTASSGFNEFRLETDSCFCEFLSETGETVMADQVERKHSYETVLTTFSGLYRFRTGTVIYITRVENDRIFFRPLTRLFRGIRLPDGTGFYAYYLYEPLKTLEMQYDLQLTDCAFWGDEREVTVMAEVSAHAQGDEKARKLDTGRLAAALKLLIENDNDLSLPPLKFLFSRPGSHRELQLWHAEKMQISYDQILPAHFVSDPEDQRFLLDRIL